METIVKTAYLRGSSKRARGEKGPDSNTNRNQMDESFKSKLLNMVSPKSWSGFGPSRERLRIEAKDITITEELDGAYMS
ncbi:hypothetical protein ACOSP7_007388 [Xanthoceras sorbifolium]